jgi:hypothetical protein
MTSKIKPVPTTDKLITVQILTQGLYQSRFGPGLVLACRDHGLDATVITPSTIHTAQMLAMIFIPRQP